jgi:hypothetical protein
MLLSLPDTMWTTMNKIFYIYIYKESVPIIDSWLWQPMETCGEEISWLLIVVVQLYTVRTACFRVSSTFWSLTSEIRKVDIRLLMDWSRKSFKMFFWHHFWNQPQNWLVSSTVNVANVCGRVLAASLVRYVSKVMVPYPTLWWEGPWKRKYDILERWQLKIKESLLVALFYNTVLYFFELSPKMLYFLFQGPLHTNWLT